MVDRPWARLQDQRGLDVAFSAQVVVVAKGLAEAEPDLRAWLAPIDSRALCRWATEELHAAEARGDSHGCFPWIVHFIGLDLAWVERSRTGIAILDEAGWLTDCRSVVTDAEIAAALPHASHGLVAAIDAPLIVRNETGQRRCEKRVGQLFGYANASAHTSNRSRALFDPEPRGARLANRFGWEMNPHVQPIESTSVCIEVYPHPAMVVLFGLDTVIQYKAKPGRDLEYLRAQHLLLLEHMERTCGPLLGLDESHDWARLREGVRVATRKVDLRVVEDQVDAVLCAFHAWMWTYERDRMLLLPEDHQGIDDEELDQGYIVTPAIR